MRQIVTRLIWMAIAVCFLDLPSGAAPQKIAEGKLKEYVVLTSSEIRKDAGWMKVVDALQKKHQAGVFYYERSPRECLPELKTCRPRYVAVVEKPEHLNRDYVIRLHQLSRETDEDIFADFLWGIITGYDAAAALKMVEQSTAPLVIKDAVATITELSSAKWFDRYAWVDDHTCGLWGEKKGKNEAVQTYRIEPENVMGQFVNLYETYDPDLVVTAAHATENNLEMPFSLGHIKAANGRLYATKDIRSRFGQALRESGKRKVYFAVGNCLIGNVNNSRESMAVGWMNSANVVTMVGYVVTTWHGRNGWGGLKYWLADPGRYTLAEAIYLNQQDFLFQQSQWYPELLKTDYIFEDENRSAGLLAEKLKANPSTDQLGFWHDRDVLAYYGDPKWEVRLQEIPEEKDYTVTAELKGGKYVVTIETLPNFSLERLQGNHFKEEHVKDLPFSYFFPERLSHPRLAAGQTYKAVVDENFMLIYDCGFQPGRTYVVTLDVE